MNNNQTGIWYSTWYSNEGTLIWLSDDILGSTSQMLGDVNGDGKDDAITFKNGNWYVAVSNGNGFSQTQKWISGYGDNSSSQMVGDVDGDGKADAISFKNGDWYVAISKGNGFSQTQKWISGHGDSSSSQMLGDVDGDGKADAISFKNGDWYVAISKGNGFSQSQKWISGHSDSSSSQMVGDVDGDGKADAISFKNGDWYVAISNGNGFSQSQKWISGYGTDSSRQIIGDVTGDGKADAVTYFGSNGEWYVANSDGSSFDSFYNWKSEHGHGSKYNQYKGSSFQGLGKISSDEAKVSPFVFYPNKAEWRVLPPEYSKPNILNTWEAWNIDYRPLTNGSYQTYDSKDPAVIDEHLKLISDAGIDFLILDLTNNIYVDERYIFERAKVLVDRISVWNSDSENTKIKYSIAIGGVQFNSNTKTIEAEANIVWNEFVQYSGADYYYLDGKPLLVSYSTNRQRDKWKGANINKSDTNQFNLQWAVPQVEEGKQSVSFFGWGFPQGSIPNDDIMVVMPGWDNKLGKFNVPRSLNSIESDFYISKGWSRVLTQNPDMVVINSFNEYAEETAVTLTDTSGLLISEKWSSPNLYWDITKKYNALYKGEPLESFNQAELLDLREIKSDVKIHFTVNREAALDNFVGFYDIVDSTGSIDTNGDGVADIVPGEKGYVEAAINGRISDINLTVNNRETAKYSATLEGNSLFAPFIITNGTPQEILSDNANNNSAVYFSFLAANSDKADHIHVFDNNTWRFEDLPGGGDMDYNDIVVAANIEIIN